MRAIIWAAVSSKSQLEGDSLDSQIRDAQAACDQFGWTVIATLTVPGHSREYVFFHEAARDMPAYASLREICADRGAEVLVCKSRDRLGRTDALIAQIDELSRRAGMQIYSMAMPSHIVAPEQVAHDRGALFAAAFERVNAQDEMMRLRERHQMGMRARIRKGLAAGTLPYGYTYQEGNPIPVLVPEEAAVIHEIGRLFVAGWGMRRIALHLGKQGPEVRTGKRWHSSAIRFILHNSFYAGWTFWGKQAIAPGKHRAVFSEEEWVAIQAEHRRRARTRGRSAHPYTGIVRCRICGRPMQASTVRKPLAGGGVSILRYYRCIEGYWDDLAPRAARHTTEVRVERIREAVLAKAKELEDPEAFTEACRDSVYQERQELEAHKAELEMALAQLSAEISRLVEAHTRFESIAIDELDGLMVEAGERRKAVQEALTAVDARLTTIPEPQDKARALEDFTERVEAILDSPDVQEANAWLSGVVKAVWCEGRAVVAIDLA